MKFGLWGGALTPIQRSTWKESFSDTLEQTKRYANMGYTVMWGGGGIHRGDYTSTLARMCAIDAGMELGALFLLPFEHPVSLAAEISKLDQLSHGRLTVAVAQGWRDGQFKSVGIPRRERLGRFLEVLEAMKLLWDQGQVSFHGKYFDFDTRASDTFVSKPIQQPYPKLLVAANADIGVKRTPSIADGWLVSSRSTDASIDRQSIILHDEAKKTGRKMDVWAFRDAYCAKDRGTAFQIAQPALEGLYADRARLGHDRDLPIEDKLQGTFEDLVRNRVAIGDPDDCAEQIQKWQQLGIDVLIMRMQWEGMNKQQGMDSMKLMAQQVLPQFR